jgi:dipeptidyl aminopeptidase/acylaminoacyl peptidase
MVMKQRWAFGAALGVGVLTMFLIAAGLLAEGALRRPPMHATHHGPALARILEQHPSVTVREVSVEAADGEVLRASWLAPPQPNGAAVIVLHGIADTRRGATGHAGYLLAAGYRVLLPDLRAHGESGGDFVTYGLREREDLKRWADWARSQHAGATSDRVFAIGTSLGAAIALQAIPEAGFAAVVAESPFACFPEIAAYRAFGLRPLASAAMLYASLRYGLPLHDACPLRSLAEDRTDTRVLLIHGVDDVNIPVEHSRRLAAVDPARVTLWEVPGAGHVQVLGRTYPAYSQRVIAFFAGHSR